MSGNQKKVQEKNSQTVDVNASSYLVFSIASRKFAFKSTLIQEIMYGAKIHKLPFVPDYIEGVLNCRGNPYTVINPLKLDNEPDSEISESVFLLFKRKDDHFCIHISNIEVFFEPEIEDVFEDKVKYKQKMIPLFDADRLETAMIRDLSSEEI
ncbi:MAG: chemotaxis protein CheW [Treponema sp.]|nr:chemotaxis protein CheW [Treponema sp.]MBQ5383243.1 chemotaxis protein CheW [Treponema sp.]